jgi:hypothetical protein
MAKKPTPHPRETAAGHAPGRPGAREPAGASGTIHRRPDACNFFVERVEKPTDNRFAGSLRWSRLDGDSPGERPVPIRHTPSARAGGLWSGWGA